MRPKRIVKQQLRNRKAEATAGGGDDDDDAAFERKAEEMMRNFVKEKGKVRLPPMRPDDQNNKESRSFVTTNAIQDRSTSSVEADHFLRKRKRIRQAKRPPIAEKTPPVDAFNLDQTVLQSQFVDKFGMAMDELVKTTISSSSTPHSSNNVQSAATDDKKAQKRTVSRAKQRRRQVVFEETEPSQLSSLVDGPPNGICWSANLRQAEQDSDDTVDGECHSHRLYSVAPGTDYPAFYTAYSDPTSRDVQGPISFDYSAMRQNPDGYLRPPTMPELYREALELTGGMPLVTAIRPQDELGSGRTDVGGQGQVGVRNAGQDDASSAGMVLYCCPYCRRRYCAPAPCCPAPCCPAPCRPAPKNRGRRRGLVLLIVFLFAFFMWLVTRICACCDSDGGCKQSSCLWVTPDEYSDYYYSSSSSS